MNFSQRIFLTSVTLFIHFLTPISLHAQHDECINAIALNSESTCNDVIIDNSQMTNNSSLAQCYGEVDSWYSFVANKTSYFFENTSTNNRLYVDVYEDCSSTQYFCRSSCNGCGFNLRDLTIGQTYFLKIGTEFPLEPAQFCFHETCALNVNNLNISSCNPIDNTYDVSFDLTYEDIDPNYALGFKIGNEAYPLFLTEPTGSIAIQVDNYFNSTGFDSGYLTIFQSPPDFCSVLQTITIPDPCVPPPSNDLCVNPESIIIGSCDQTIPVSIIGATDPYTNRNLDLWYTFSPTTTEVIFGNTGDKGLIYYTLYDDCDNIGSHIDGYAWWGQSKSISNLIIGNNYLLRIQLLYNNESEFSLFTDNDPPELVCQPIYSGIRANGIVTVYNYMSYVAPHTDTGLAEIDNCTIVYDHEIFISLDGQNYVEELNFDCSDLGKEHLITFKV